MNTKFSFIILTFNEELNLDRLLDSIAGLEAPTYILDSGSTDKTLEICNSRKIEVQSNTFINHPQQWDYALRNFNITTPWTIGLDADQTVSPELYKLLQRFTPADHSNIDGIYFNRKNYFQNQWIRHGGYYPMYLLKMFKTHLGYSDLSENMDHRFQVPGKTIIWNDGHIIEENLKERSIGFWIDKHNTYSNLIAEEEVMKSLVTTHITYYQALFGNPNQRKIWKKQIWFKLPRFIRPTLYLLYRLIIQRGLLDGKKGIIFHFLHAFWFRLIVDLKIEERLHENSTVIPFPHKRETYTFLIKFICLFLVFYSINIGVIAISSPGGFYVPFVETHINYIQFLRNTYISGVTIILRLLGYEVITSPFGLGVLNHAGFKLVYSCLGYGLMSCFSAFAFSIPKPFTSRYLFLASGICLIFLLNIFRLLLVALYYNPKFNIFRLDHHEIFNIATYLTIVGFSYLYLKLKKHDE
jgi:exosortase/archaeosortase family protein